MKKFIVAIIVLALVVILAWAIFSSRIGTYEGMKGTNSGLSTKPASMSVQA
jgi:hypothetical protein